MRRGRGYRLITTLLLTGLLLVSPSLISSPTSASNQTPEPNLETFFTTLEAAPRLKNNSSPRVYAKSYLLIDAQTATVVAAKNSDQPLPIASTTKMATALVARQLFDLDEVVTVRSEIRQVPGSTINLVVNEKMTVHDLLRGLLIQSGNDAAFSLAYHLTNDGEYLPFVQKMNELSEQHNLPASHYNDPAGLNDEGHSTAFELATIARLVLNDPVLAEIVATASTTVFSTDGRISHQLKNSNRLVVPEESLYMSDVLGVKTGFTPAAGHCLVSAIEIDGRKFIGVVLNTDEYTITASAKEMYKLFSWAKNTITFIDYR